MASYGTSFVGRAYGGPGRILTFAERAKRDFQRAEKSISRRLEVPLREGSWIRALEILHFRPTMEGRTPDHYRALIRSIVEHQGSEPSSRVPLPAVVDFVHDTAKSDDIPGSAALFVTLVWAYCTSGQIDRALSAAADGRRLWGYSPADSLHIGNMLLDAAVKFARPDIADSAAINYFMPAERERADVKGRLRDALSKRGTCWKAALGFLARSSTVDTSLLARAGVSACADGNWLVALDCYGRLLSSSAKSNVADEAILRPWLLNTLGARGNWVESIAVVTALVNQRLPVDETTSNLLFAALPSADDESSDSRIATVFLNLSFSCDVFEPSPMSKMIAASSLARTGAWQVAAGLLRTLDGARLDSALAPLASATVSSLKALGGSAAAVSEALRRSLFRHGRPPRVSHWASYRREATMGIDLPSVRPSMKSYFRSRFSDVIRQTSTPTLLSAVDARVAESAVDETAKDPFSDPRPAPVGKHALHAGYAYYGMGDLKKWTRHSRVATPTSLSPKRMPHLGNPNRSWARSSVHAVGKRIPHFNPNSSI